MIIIDFLVFNLTNWYYAHPNLLSWSTPIGRATYVVGLITIIWMFNFWIIINIIFHKTVSFGFGSLPFVIVGLAAMEFYKYIYEKKGRYERICNSANKPLNVRDNVGQALSSGFAFFSLFVLGLLILFFAP